MNNARALGPVKEGALGSTSSVKHHDSIVGKSRRFWKAGSRVHNGDRPMETGRKVVRESLRSFREMVVSHPSVEDRDSHTYLEVG